MRVTDATEYNPKATQIFILGGYLQYLAKDPMAYYQVSDGDPGLLYRIGY